MSIDQARLLRLLQNEADMGFKRRVRYLFRALDFQPTDRVLDAGCGRGFFMKYVTELAPCRYFGVDLDFEHLEIALRQNRARGASVARSLIEPLPFADDTFDKIIFSEVLEHLPDDWGGLNEIKRVLKPGGLLFLTVPNHNYPFWWDPINKSLETVFHTHISMARSRAFGRITSVCIIPTKSRRWWRARVLNSKGFIRFCIIVFRSRIIWCTVWASRCLKKACCPKICARRRTVSAAKPRRQAR